MAVSSIIGRVPSHWDVLTLGDACRRSGGDVQTGPFGSQLHAADYVPVGIPSIMPKNIGDNRVNVDDIARITPDDAVRLTRYRVRPGDIVYSRRGDVERRALIRDAEDGWLCGTGCLRVRFGDGGIEPPYASFYLGHPLVRKWIVRHAHGATMPNLNTSILSALPFVIPPIEEQRRIAETLGAYDDKIELNRRMNETLEAMARAIFKSWFVDFDPVRAKAEGRQPQGIPAHIADLFPDSFLDSPLGPIPKDWEASTLGDAFKKLLGGNWGKGEQDDVHTRECYCIRGTDIPDINRGGIGNMPLRWLKPSLAAKRILEPGDIVVEVSGGSPTQSTGRAVHMWSKWLDHIDLPIVYSNFCRLFKPEKPEESMFLFEHIDLAYRKDKFFDFENGTTGIKNLDVNAFLETFIIARPPVELTRAFNSVVLPLRQLIIQNGIESDTLAATRDTLLAKLLSGEVTVGGAA